MSKNNKHENPSSNQSEKKTETTSVCDLCCGEGPIHEVRLIAVCRLCDLNFDDILDGRTEDFSTQPQTALPPLLAELCKEQQGICGICKQRIEPWERMHIDHIVPRSRGGSDERSNLQAAHAVCNLRKGNRMPPPEGGTTTRESQAGASEPGGSRTDGPDDGQLHTGGASA